jgi:hypothetical protein
VSLSNPAWLSAFAPMGEDPAPLVPILLLDAFALETGDTGRVRCAVVGCVGGELRLVPESHIHRLPKLLLEGWWRVASRPLRTVRATDFALCVIDAFSATEQGWRCWLRVMVHVHVHGREVALEPLALRGELEVSGVAARVSLKHSALCAFDNPRAAGEITHHWWLPVGAPQDIAAGRGLLLAYTLPDPAVFEGADNRAVQRRLETDLLETDLGAGEAGSDPLAVALETFLTLESSVGVAALRADPVRPPPPAVAPKRTGTPITPSAYPNTNQPGGTAGASGRDWSSDFAASTTPKRATQGRWWRDFAPDAVGVEDVYAAPQGSSTGYSSDFD